jgi:Domain of unknown function (DUF5076)
MRGRAGFFVSIERGSVMPELPPPPEAGANDQAFEILRAWIIRSSLHCTLQSDAFDEVEPWGEVLADVVDHLARAREQLDGTARADTIRRLRDVFNVEVDGMLGD